MGTQTSRQEEKETHPIVWQICAITQTKVEKVSALTPRLRQVLHSIEDRLFSLEENDWKRHLVSGLTQDLFGIVLSYLCSRGSRKQTLFLNYLLGVYEGKACSYADCRMFPQQITSHETMSPRRRFLLLHAFGYDEDGCRRWNPDLEQIWTWNAHVQQGKESAWSAYEEDHRLKCLLGTWILSRIEEQKATGKHELNIAVGIHASNKTMYETGLFVKRREKQLFYLESEHVANWMLRNSWFEKQRRFLDLTIMSSLFAGFDCEWKGEHKNRRAFGTTVTVWEVSWGDDVS
jgi:hypothetical protein